MKKISLIFAAMIAMAQMNAAIPIDAVTASEVPIATVAADNDSESTYKHPFQDDDESTKHWTVTSSGVYIGMGVKHNFDKINNSFEVGLLNFAAVNYNSLHGQNLSLGVGIHHRSYSMKRPNMLIRNEHNAVNLSTYPDALGELKNRSSNLNQWTVQFPLMFTQKIVKKLDITIAGILNWNVYARADNHYEFNKIETDERYKGLKQEKINFDFMGVLSWGRFGIYCRYTPGKFFKEGYGPEIKNTWTMGVTLGM